MSNTGDPFDEIVDMVKSTLRAVDEVRKEVGGKVDDNDLRESERDQRAYVDSKAADQITTLKQMMENMGTSLLNDFENMGRDTEKRMVALHQKFIDENLTPMVGRLVADEVRRKNEIEEKEAERRAEKVRAEEAEARAQKAEKRLKVIQVLGAFGVTVTIAWTAFRFYMALTTGAG